LAETAIKSESLKSKPLSVVDLGSMWTRIGMTDEQQPKTIERTMKGRIRKTIYQNSSDQYILYGNDVSTKSGTQFISNW